MLIALRYWRNSPQVWDKGGEHGPVTEADLAVNDMLKAKLLAARPDYGWLSEETPDSADRLAVDTVFIVDPIDGTRAFIARGGRNYAHSLAVVQRGKVTAGVVYLPAMDRIYTASETWPRCGGEMIRASGRDRLEGANILTTKANMVPEKWPGGVPEITRSFRASLAYGLAAEGRFDGMLTLRDAWEWDIAAGSLIAEQAGGGGPLTGWARRCASTRPAR